MFEWLRNPQIVQTITVWIGAFCTLGIYSLLYRENKVYRFFEHLFLGLATGWTLASTWNNILLPSWWTPLWTEGKWYFIFALPAGMLFYFIYSSRHSWMSRLIFGLFFGAAAGQAFQTFAGQYFKQFKTVVSINPFDPDPAYLKDGYFLSSTSWAINSILFIGILAAVMTYFFFSFEQKGKIIPRISLIGRYVLMFAFGALFGSTIMARMSLLIGRVYFLIHEWLHWG
jgi:hypothetical protein